MTKRTKQPTAAELMQRLQANQDFVARQEKAEIERQRRAAEWRRAEAPLVKELRAAGFAVESAWDLVNTAQPYSKALPILVAHLQRPYPGAVREGIARALALPEARFAWRVLTKLYREEQDTRVRDGLATAIAAAANEEVIGDLIDLVREKGHGPSRLLLLGALERSRDPRAYEALAELAADPELQKEIRVILRRLQRRKGDLHSEPS